MRTPLARPPSVLVRIVSFFVLSTDAGLLGDRSGCMRVPSRLAMAPDSLDTSQQSNLINERAVTLLTFTMGRGWFLPGDACMRVSCAYRLAELVGSQHHIPLCQKQARTSLDQRQNSYSPLESSQ